MNFTKNITTARKGLYSGISTERGISKVKEPTLAERGVVSVWVLHEAWLFSMETIKTLFEEKKITAIKKRRLESKYTSFYQNSRPKDLKTKDDILLLEDNARKMMLMLADLGVDAYKLLYKQF